MVILKLNTNPISDHQIEKRKDLEKKLQAEIVELEMLEKSLSLVDNATERMTNMLTSFDNRLARLESYIMPIHNSTQLLSRTNNNLEAALSLISAYTTIVGTINFHEAIVAKGLTQNSLETYLDSVKKLKDSLRQLENSKYKSSERITQDLRGRISKGMQELDDLFSKTLIACGDSETESDKQNGTFSFGERLKTLQVLAEVLSDTLEQIGPVTGFLKIYSDARSNFLVKCSAHHNAAAKEQEGKMGYTREIYQRGSSLLIPYARLLIVILQAEYAASSDVIPKHHLPTTFVNSVTASIDGFLEVCEALLNRVRRNIQRKEMNDLYVLIDVWDGLSGVFLPYSNLMAQCGKKGHDIQTFLLNASSTVLNHFKDFFEECKPSDSEAKKQAVLSLDGTVHEMTSMTMNAVKKLHEYNDALVSILEGSKSIGVVFPTETFKEYINKIIEFLIIDIDTKAKSYKKPVLSSLFILNNSHYVLKSIKGTELMEVIDAQVLETIEKTIKKQLDNYRGTWIPVIEHLMDNTKISDQGKMVTQLSKTQKDTIKKKFESFNKDFDELYITQKTYAIPDPELRAQVIKEVRQILCPMYDRFYDRYTTNLEFTKNVDKYVRLNKEELSAKLDSFFTADGQ